MVSIREVAKRKLPPFVRGWVVGLREQLSAPPLEDIVLHDYKAVVDRCTRHRLSLVIPGISPAKAFGGVTTGIEIFLEVGKRTGAELRIILDDFEQSLDTSVIEKQTKALDLTVNQVEILRRTQEKPIVGVRRRDIFLSFNWWTTLNILTLLRFQQERFEQPALPLIYLMQEYEPQFYPFSTTHMLARLAFEPPWPCWGIFNSVQLYDYYKMQGHNIERAFVFEPKLSGALVQSLNKEQSRKKKRVLVYGRPEIPRNCFSAIQKGLLLWAKSHAEFSDWEIISVGLPHKALQLGNGRTMRSIGKLQLEAYGELLQTTAVGLSLMSSPHPSYPPLEMAHFGVLTITNKYADKDLSSAHDNIISISDIRPETIAEALAIACGRFANAPDGGWFGKSRMTSFLLPGPLDCVDELSNALKNGPWKQTCEVGKKV